MNVDPSTLKAQADMIKGMSDEQLRSMSQMKGMNVDPAMLRQSAAMMQNMTPEQVKNMTEMASKMYANGQLPPGFAPPPGVAPQPAPKPTAVSLCEELESVRVLKDCGNVKFKEKKLDEAEKLYNDAILKLEDVRASIPQTQKNNLLTLEVSILLNLSNIKAQQSDFHSLLNLAKQVVILDPQSGKGYLRYSQALHGLEKHQAALEKIRLAEKYSSFSEIGELKSEILKKLGKSEADEPKPSQMEETSSEIREDPPTRPGPIAASTPGPAQTVPPGFMPPAGGPMPDPSQISDGQLDMMKNMMSTADGRNMIRNMMKAQTGMDMSDEQLNMMSGMMNRETLQMASAQMKNNPELANQMGRPGMNPAAGGLAQNTANPGFAAAGTTPGQMPANPQGMEDMMKKMQSGEQPGMDDLLKNKDMFKMMFGMMKSNPAMIRGITAQLGETHPVSKFISNKSDDDLRKYAGWMEKLMGAVMFCYPAFKLVKQNFKAIMFFIACYLLYKYFL